MEQESFQPEVSSSPLVTHSNFLPYWFKMRKTCSSRLEELAQKLSKLRQKQCQKISNGRELWNTLSESPIFIATVPKNTITINNRKKTPKPNQIHQRVKQEPKWPDKHNVDANPCHLRFFRVIFPKTLWRIFLGQNGVSKGWFPKLGNSCKRNAILCSLCSVKKWKFFNPYRADNQQNPINCFLVQGVRCTPLKISLQFIQTSELPCSQADRQRPTNYNKNRDK